MEFNFVRLRHMLLDLCTGNAAICALPQWPVLFIYHLIPLLSIHIPWFPLGCLVLWDMNGYDYWDVSWEYMGIMDPRIILT